MGTVVMLSFYATIILLVLSFIIPSWVMGLFRNKLSKKEVRILLIIAPIIFLSMGSLVTNKEDIAETASVPESPQTEEPQVKENSQPLENVDKKEDSPVKVGQESKTDILLPGDEVFLKYDTETTEKIYVADSLETYEVLKKSYAIKDNESRWELILEGKVIAVPSGTKVRILDYVDVSGAEKVRILEGEHYPFEGYAPYPLLKRK